MRTLQSFKVALLLLFILVLLLQLSKPESQNLVDELYDALGKAAFHLESGPIISHLPSTNVSLAQLCDLLSTKVVLLVGSETTYYLHSLWINALGLHEGQHYPCSGPEFCTFHHVCKRFIPEPTELGPGYTSSEVYNERIQIIPNANDLLTTDSSVIRFVLSSSLYVSRTADDPIYHHPQVDPRTGVRVKDMYWIGKAKKADILILNRGPVSAPAWSYSRSREHGNWTFVDDLYSDTSSIFLSDGKHKSSPSRSPASSTPSARHIVNAALHATVTVFLPAFESSLRSLRNDPKLKHNTVIWHGSWFMVPECWKKERVSMSDLTMLLSATSDPWALYYNAQVHIHDRILPPLLARYGVVYIPLSTSFVNNMPTGSYQRQGKYDCLRPLSGSPMAEKLLESYLHQLINVV